MRRFFVMMIFLLRQIYGTKSNDGFSEGILSEFQTKSKSIANSWDQLFRMLHMNILVNESDYENYTKWYTQVNLWLNGSEGFPGHIEINDQNSNAVKFQIFNQKVHTAVESIRTKIKNDDYLDRRKIGLDDDYLHFPDIKDLGSGFNVEKKIHSIRLHMMMQTLASICDRLQNPEISEDAYTPTPDDIHTAWGKPLDPLAPLDLTNIMEEKKWPKNFPPEKKPALAMFWFYQSLVNLKKKQLDFKKHEPISMFEHAKDEFGECIRDMWNLQYQVDSSPVRQFKNLFTTIEQSATNMIKVRIGDENYKKLLNTVSQKIQEDNEKLKRKHKAY